MEDSEVGFAPIKIDSGESVHVISGVSGQLLKVDDQLNQLGEVSQPFPALITSSTIVKEKWIGTVAADILGPRYELAKVSTEFHRDENGVEDNDSPARCKQDGRDETGV